ncbi:MAG: sigma-70 family RNA polymerase sigma factor [Terracidiphilus sp.]
MNTMGQDLSFNLPINQLAALRDAQLLSEARAGSSAAFAELQNLYSRHLYNRIVAITKNREDAEDALQDTFLRAYLALCKFEGRSSFCSWLTRIAINSALMVLRKRRARPEAPFDPYYELGDEIVQFEIRDPAPNPEQIFDQRQRCSGMMRAIQKLDPTLRGAIQTRMAQGSSLKEIALALGISEAAVKARLHRARARLNATQVFRNEGAKRKVSSGSPRKGLIPGRQNREQLCMNSTQYA